MSLFARLFGMDKASKLGCHAKSDDSESQVKDESVMVLVPSGEFEMGDGKNDDCPKHRVYLDAYYIGAYCVTNRQYARFVEKTGHRKPDNERWNKSEYAEHPVVNVAWEDATAYAGWAGCKLPTEAQWERAARGPAGLVYPWGDEWDESRYRNYNNRGSEETTSVDDYAAGISGYGTYQQSGNVYEWCRDWYGGCKMEGVQKNPAGPEIGLNRVGRGGSWRIDDSDSFRGASRAGFYPAYRDDDVGFRLVRRAP